MASAANVQLLQQLAGMAMAEDSIRGEIVCRMHEMRLRSGRFAGAGNTGLGIADNAAIADQPSRQQPVASGRE